MPMIPKSASLYITFAIAFEKELLACPICHTDTAKIVRAGLAESFSHWPSILAAVSPFIILGLIVFMMDNLTFQSPRSSKCSSGERNHGR